MVDSCAKKYTKSISWRVNTLGNSDEIFYSRMPIIASSKNYFTGMYSKVSVNFKFTNFCMTTKNLLFCNLKNKLQLSASSCIFSNIFHTSKKPPKRHSRPSARRSKSTDCWQSDSPKIIQKKNPNFIFVLEKYTFSRTSHPS